MLIISDARLKLLEPRQKRKRRRLWVKSWLLQRERIGTYNNFVNELRRISTRRIYFLHFDWLEKFDFAAKYFALQESRNDFYFLF